MIFDLIGDMTDQKKILHFGPKKHNFWAEMGSKFEISKIQKIPSRIFGNTSCV